MQFSITVETNLSKYSIYYLGIYFIFRFKIVDIYMEFDVSGKRSIFFDLETTSANIYKAEIIEIFALEMIDDTPTGKSFHRLINPRSDIPDEIETLTGLNKDQLKDGPSFKDIKDPLLEFIGDGDPSNAKNTTLGAHNLHFDAFILNRHLMSDAPKYVLRTDTYLRAVFNDRKNNFTTLERDLSGPGITKLSDISQINTIDTMRIVGKMEKILHTSGPRFGQPKWPNLEESCRVLEVDASDRKQHGAAIDTMLAAECYLASRGYGADDPRRQKTREYCRPYFRDGQDAVAVPSVEHASGEAASKSDPGTISSGGSEASDIAQISKKKPTLDIVVSPSSPSPAPVSRLPAPPKGESNASADQGVSNESKKRKAGMSDDLPKKRLKREFDRSNHEIGRGG